MAKLEARPRKSRWALPSQSSKPQGAGGSFVPSDVFLRDRYVGTNDVRMMGDAADAASKDLMAYRNAYHCPCYHDRSGVPLHSRTTLWRRQFI